MARRKHCRRVLLSVPVEVAQTYGDLDEGRDVRGIDGIWNSRIPAADSQAFPSLTRRLLAMSLKGTADREAVKC